MIKEENMPQQLRNIYCPDRALIAVQTRNVSIVCMSTYRPCHDTPNLSLKSVVETFELNNPEEVTLQLYWHKYNVIKVCYSFSLKTMKIWCYDSSLSCLVPFTKKSSDLRNLYTKCTQQTRGPLI